MPHALLTDKSRALQRRREALEAERRSIESASGPRIDIESLAAKLREVLAKIRAFLLRANDEDFELALTALQLTMSAARDHVDIAGVDPPPPANDQPDDLYATIERTSA